MKTAANEPVTGSGTPQQQAWAWLRLLHSGEVRRWDMEGFQRWLQADQSHRDAFHAARQQWTALTPVAATVARRHPEAVTGLEPRLAERLHTRRAFLGAALGTAAVAGIVVMHPPAGLWPAPRHWGADYRTAKGEQRQIDLDPQIRITLNTQTRIRRRAGSEAALGFDLLSGEAAIDLPESASGRAFVVVAGAGRTQAGQGRFEVRALAGEVCVTCLSGSVQVEHPRGRHVLVAGQQTRYDDSTLGAVQASDPLQAAAWRKGELVFNKTRLAEAIEEINRYRPGRVVLLTPALADRPVSGSFYIASLDEALTLLQRTFELDSRKLPGGWLLLS